MSTALLMAGLVAAVTPAPVVVMFVLVGRGGRMRQAVAAAGACVVTLLASAELFRRTEVEVPSVDGATTSLLLGIAFLLTALVVLAFSRLGRRRREVPWVDLLDASGVVLAAAIMVGLVACNIKNQTLLAVALGDDSSPRDSLRYALVGSSSVLALLAAGAILRDRLQPVRAAHDWLERRQTILAIVTFAVVGCALVAAGIA